MDVDSQLVGHWRHTHSQSGDGFSMATDTHYQLGADGRFTWYAKTAGGAGESAEGPAYGRWGVSGGRLLIAFDHGEQVSAAYQVQGDRLFLPEEEHYRLWERVG